MSRTVLQSPIPSDRVIFEKAEQLRLDYQLKQSVIARRLGISMSHLTRVLKKERKTPAPACSAARKTRGDGVLNMVWAVYQLADDDATYGEQAGKYIITADNHNIEVVGVIHDLAIADAIVEAHNFKILHDGGYEVES